MFRRLTCARRRPGRKTRKRRDGCWPLRWCSTGGREKRPPRLARWSGRRCAIGCIATTSSGLEGLTDRHRRNGPQPRLSAEQQAKVAEWVERGPDLERDGVVRWRCVDLQQRIMQEFAVALHERTVGKLLRKLSFRRLSVRPQHPQSVPDEQAVFRAVLPIS